MSRGLEGVRRGRARFHGLVLVDDDELDAAVLRAVPCRDVRRDGLRLTIALGDETVRADAVRREPRNDGARAIVAQLHVVIRSPRVVRVALDLDLPDTRILDEDVRDLGEEAGRL